MDIQRLFSRFAPGQTRIYRLCSGLANGICLLTLAVVLGACGKAPTSSLSIGTNNWIGFQPFYIAREKQYFNEQAVKLVELNNSTDVMHELRSRQLDGAALTMDEVFTLLEQGVDMRVVLLVDISNGADAVLAKDNIQSVAGLADKKVAVEYSAVGATLLNAALTSAGLHTDDIQIVPCAWDKHIECFRESDAVVTFEPAKTKILNLGARVLFDSSQIKGRIIDVLSIRADVIEEKADAVRSLINAYFQALDYMKTKPAMANEIIQQRTKLTADEVAVTLEGITIPGLAGNIEMFGNEQLQENARQLVDLMVENKLLDNPVPIKVLFSGAYLPR